MIVSTPVEMVDVVVVSIDGMGVNGSVVSTAEVFVDEVVVSTIIGVITDGIG